MKCPLSANAFSYVTTCVNVVIRNLVHLTIAGLQAHDWHTGNIAFMRGDPREFVLVDWENNKEAEGSHSIFSVRAKPAMRSFLKYLDDDEYFGRGAFIHQWRQVILYYLSLLPCS